MPIRVDFRSEGDLLVTTLCRGDVPSPRRGVVFTGRCDAIRWFTVYPVGHGAGYKRPDRVYNVLEP